MENDGNFTDKFYVILTHAGDIVSYQWYNYSTQYEKITLTVESFIWLPLQFLFPSKKPFRFSILWKRFSLNKGVFTVFKYSQIFGFQKNNLVPIALLVFI